MKTSKFQKLGHRLVWLTDDEIKKLKEMLK